MFSRSAETILDSTQGAVIALILVHTVKFALMNHVQNVQDRLVQIGISERIRRGQQETARQAIELGQILAVGLQVAEQ